MKTKILIPAFLMTILLLTAKAFADCSCKMGSNGIYIVGIEFIATSCPSDPISDTHTYHYLDYAVRCPGSTILNWASWGDTYSSPQSLQNYYVSNGYRILRNESGTHIYAVSTSYKGTLAGVNFNGLAAGVYYADIDGYCCDLPGNTYTCSSSLPDDDDGDGYNVCFDCDDNDETLNPGEDNDGDGYSACDDCDDNDETKYPGDDDGDGVDSCEDECPDTNEQRIEKVESDGCAPCDIDLTGTKSAIMSGDQVEVYNRNIQDDGIKYTVTPSGPDMVWEEELDENNVLIITVDENSGKGILSVTAIDEYADKPCVNVVPYEIEVNSCESCAGQCEVISNSSVHVSIGLGMSMSGKEAGKLTINSDIVSPTLATVEELILVNKAYDVSVVYDGDNLRQIIAPEYFVDIVTLDDYSYEIRLYHPDALSDVVDGLYTVIESSTPQKTWLVENPDASADIYNRLTLSKIQDGSVVNEYEFVYDESTNTWSIDNGDGLSIKTVQRETSGDLEIKTEIVKNSLDEVASTVQTTYKEYNGIQRTIESVVDPDNFALTTTVSFYEESDCTEGSCGRIRQKTMPDGSWVKYEYDTEGRITRKIASWLDQPATASDDDVVVTEYDYTIQDASDTNAIIHTYSPRLITRYIQGIVTEKTYYVYQEDLEGRVTAITEKCTHMNAAYGDSTNLTTITITNPYSMSEENTAESGKVQSITYPDGRLETYTYEYGTYEADFDPSQPGTFTVGNGYDIRETLTNGTEANPEGIAHKTTRTVTIYSDLGRKLLRTTQVYDGSAYEEIDFSLNEYDDYGHVVQIYNSNGTSTQTDWSCCNESSDIQADGTTLFYGYDALQRLDTITREGFDGTSDITTSYTFDAAGRTLSTMRTAGTLVQSTSTYYDTAGRLDYTVDTAGLITDYEHSTDNLTTTVTNPGGTTEIMTNYLDGRVKSITGTDVVPRYYTYGVNSDGTQWTQVNIGSTTSPMWEKTVTDMVGRTVSAEKPGYAGTETVQYVYDTQGRLVKTTDPARADTLFEYDELGNQVRSGLDIDANGALDISSNDRISDTDTHYTELSSNWWQETTQTIYPESMSDTYVTTSSRTRLTGLGTPASESVSVDIHGNETRQTVQIDPSTRTVTRTTDYPDATNDGVSITTNGLLQSVTGKTGHLITYQYDDLGRRIGVTDPRTGTTTTHYNTQGQVDYVMDAAGNQTGFTYDVLTGRKVSETNSANQTTYYDYDDLGNTIQIWGEAEEPVEYVYDAYGRMNELHTFREGSGWDASSWPTSSTGIPDVTTWHYQEATGLVTSKEYADASAVSYTYYPGGNLETRTWARGATTTYTYDSGTGELAGIDYSDATPDLTFAYDRLGRKQTVTDAVGSRTFAYNSTLDLETETITGLYDRVITRTYDATGVPGRYTGFGTDSDYSVVYGYEADTGRFSTLTFDLDASSDMVTYAYEPDSDLLSGHTTLSGQDVLYTYETNRNLKTQVKNSFDSVVISQYDYQYNELGNRTGMTTSGAAPWTDPTFPEELTTYETNALNQYNSITDTDGTESLFYDNDGNLTEYKNKIYKYNGENRLILVEPESPLEGDTMVEFEYDYMGRRVEKTVYVYSSGAWDDGTSTLFVYDGWNLIEELDDAQAVQKAYVWGLDLSQSLQEAGGVGGLLAAVDDAVTYLYSYDGNGNVGQVIDTADGSVDAHYEFDPYGNLVNQSGDYADENMYRFSTKYFDEEVNLYYYGYRYYSSQLGRWINRDPVSENGGFNLYTMVANNPADKWDFLGQFTPVYSPTVPVRSVDSIQNIVGATPDGMYGVQTAEAVKGFQQYLTTLGHYSGAIDGRWDTLTELAYQRYLASRRDDAEGPSYADGLTYLEAGFSDFETACENNTGASRAEVGCCKKEARKIINALKQAWTLNYGFGPDLRGRDPVAGHFCWDWANIFNRAASLSLSYWDNEQGYALKPGSYYVHWFVKFYAYKIRDLRYRVNVDDGFMIAGRMVFPGAFPDSYSTYREMPLPVPPNTGRNQPLNPTIPNQW